MDAQVPAVVAVVVTTGPAPWFDEALSSLAAQEYEELSVLVLSVGEDEDHVTERVAQVLPDAFVRHLPGRRGYTAAANEALDMVEGAAFFLLCHDDVALDSGCVHRLVEESFRSNAGVVSPKFLNWDDPRVLLHVGLSCDKTGAVVDRVLEGEVDHGQHDAVRDIFVAPTGCILIRADLWRELGGFDPGIVAMGEDLDLSWRAQVAGARIVVAPEARVRHREAVVGGLEPLAVEDPDQGRRQLTLQMLQRRHELRAVLKCDTRFHRLRVVPQAALLALGEIIVAALARDGERVRAVAGAWRWNLRHRREISALRAEVAAHRMIPDSEVRRLQLRGSARLSRYLSRLTHQGLEAANAASDGRRGLDEPAHEPGGVAVLTGSVGHAFSEDTDFDELDDLGYRSGRDRFGRRVRTPPLGTGRQRTLVVVLALAVVVFGTRELLFGSLPLVGQLAPLPSWSTSWHHLFSGWQSVGVGTTAPASPAFGVIAFVGTVLLGSMGTAQHVLLLGCIPLGAVGLSRFMRPIVSARARVVAIVCYLGLPLPYGALGTGRWDGLVAYALFPFVATSLARAGGLAPYVTDQAAGWRGSRAGQMAVLGLYVALAGVFAPAVFPMVLITGLSWAVGSLLVGTTAGALRVVTTALGGIGVALVLTAPWAIGTVLAGHSAVAVFGLPVAAANTPDWGEVVRFAVGPTARSPLVWLLIAAAALPLVIARGPRLTWAARLWVLAVACWVLALVTTRGDVGSFTPSETVVLAPAAFAVAAAVGLGISAFENDLGGLEFGWRQVVSVIALLSVAVGLLPVAAASAGGRWGLPSEGVEQPLSFLGHPSPSGVARVLWLGDPRALPVGGWSARPGLAYSLTPDVMPDSSQVLTPAGPGPAALAGEAVRLAASGGTVHLGQLLAGAGVREVIVVDGLAPSMVGTEPTSVSAPPPAGLLEDLLEQSDLQAVPGQTGVQVFVNRSFIPVTAARGAPLPSGSRWTYPGAADVLGWRPALSSSSASGSASGPVRSGTVYAAYAPAGSFSLETGGKQAVRRQAFGWAAQYATPAGSATLSFTSFPYVPVSVLLEVVLWATLALALLGWPLRARRRPTLPAQAGASTDSGDERELEGVAAADAGP
jgi:GT2 family glycosyltransferase